MPKFLLGCGTRKRERAMSRMAHEICEAGSGCSASSQKLVAGSLSVSSKFYGQATKGAWWMPWQKTAMKDVASCDKPRGAASRL